MSDNTAPPTGGEPQQEVRINSDQIIALVGVFFQASDTILEPVLTAIINHLLTQERTMRLDPRVPAEALENLKNNRKGLEVFRTMKAGLHAIRVGPQGPQIVVPTLLHPGRPS